jgi:hypothetical protein
MSKAELRKIKKGIELIKLILNKLNSSSINVIFNVRDSVHHIFYDGNRIDETFLWVFPVEELREISNILQIIRSANSTFNNNELSSPYGSTNTADLNMRLNRVLSILENVISRHGFNVFYSWQSDLPNNTNRGFIEDALEKAIKKCNKDQGIFLTVDKDTTGRTGSPDIAHTIMEKISNSFMFVADISTVINTNDRKSPNPNVLIELGYALGVMGEENILMLQNSEFGTIEELPFDLRGKRVMQYSCSTCIENDLRASVKANLTERLYNAIKARTLAEIA